MTSSSRRKDRRETKPAFSSRKLKLGTFQTNLDSALLAWPRVEQGMREFRDVAYPLLQQAVGFRIAGIRPRLAFGRYTSAGEFVER